MKRGTRAIGFVPPIKTGVAAVDRAQAKSAETVNKLANAPLSQAVAVPCTLEWGPNKVGHGLGRAVYELVHAAAAEPWAVITSIQDENPAPHTTFWVYLHGAAETKATLFLLPVS